MIEWLKKHNILFWVLSLFVAVVLWMYVQVSLDPEATKTLNNILITPVGEETLLTDRNLRIMSGLDTTVSLRLRGRRPDLDACNEQNVQVIVDLKDVEGSSPHNLKYEVRLPASVSGPTLEWSSPTYITVTSDEIISRVLDIEVGRKNMSVASDYNLEDVRPEPAQVRVTGPSKLVNTIARAQAMPSAQAIDRTMTLRLPVELVDAAGSAVVSDMLEMETREVSVLLKVSMTKDVPLEVDIIEGGGAFRRHADITVSPKTIRLTGDPGILENTNRIVLGVVDLSKTPNGITRSTMPIKPPNETTAVDGYTDATVTVNITGLTVMRIDTENISTVGGRPPAGYEINIVTQSIPAMVRGPLSSVELVSTHNIRVVADLTDWDLIVGQQTVTAQVSIDGVADVGVLGDYKIVIDVVKAANTS
ncbi:MAG: hypothetical protein LBC26_01200 [Oscillospiraceae bacterium]|jgi:YbbR domain-containing protein|nr:hypothetical protein [Oscillospiraceae bacterium]